MCHERGWRRAWMGWKWASYPVLRFKRTEVEKDFHWVAFLTPEALRTDWEPLLRLGIWKPGSVLEWIRVTKTGKQRKNAPRGGLRELNPSSGPVQSLRIPHRAWVHGSGWNPCHSGWSTNCCKAIPFGPGVHLGTEAKHETALLGSYCLFWVICILSFIFENHQTVFQKVLHRRRKRSR